MRQTTAGTIAGRLAVTLLVAAARWPRRQQPASLPTSQASVAG
jgi:hypothetical protein